jgi:lipoprotein-releasing system ATP-binding protein
MADPVVLLEGVRKSFGTAVVTEVLRGIDLRIERGEFAALIGPSGSGKSTLLNILGLLDRPTAGRVAIAGEETTRLDDAGLTRLRGRAIGFIFQFHHLLPGLTARENVMMPMIAAAGRTAKEMAPRALTLLDRVGLGAKVDAYPNEM